MKCAKCDYVNEEGDLFCRNCGNKLETKEKKTAQKEEKEKVEDTKFEEAYIGKNYEKFKTDTFNVGAFILGPIYLLYRRMYLIFVLYFVISIAFMCMPIVPNIILAFTFNLLYLNIVKSKISQFRSSTHLNDEELLDFCKRNGGTDMVMPAVLCFIFFVILLFTMYTMHKVVKNIDLNDELYVTNHELRYHIPEDYIIIAKNSFMTDSDFHNCSITINEETHGSYISEEEAIKEAVGYQDFQTKFINNHKWYYYEKNDLNKDKTYKYVTIYHGNIYYVDFNISDDKDNYCTKSMNKFVNTLNFIDTVPEEA